MNVEEATREMERLIEAFPANMTEAIAIGKRATAGFRTRPVQQVLISGLGGSGIGGKIMSQLVSDQCKVPVQVVHDYRIPAWVGPDTLFIASTYSGNTEETLTTVQAALSAGAEVVCITSGGKLRAIAEMEGCNLIEIPGGQPPRTTFGYNAMQQLFVLSAYGLLPTTFDFVGQLEAAAALLRSEAGTMHAQAAAVAKKIEGTTPIIYAETWFEGVALRLRQQFNENAKTLCWHHALPEMNHNELVAWAGGSSAFSAIFLRTDDDHPSTARRMELSMEIVSKYTDQVIELWAQGHSRIERAYYLIHLGDWISYFMAVGRGVDPIEIAVIDYFKQALSKG